jgi:hypothetical protein
MIMAAPLLHCTNVLFTLLVCTVLAHFFTFTLTFVPLSSNRHRLYCGHMIWLLANPLQYHNVP